VSYKSRLLSQAVQLLPNRLTWPSYWVIGASRKRGFHNKRRAIESSNSGGHVCVSASGCQKRTTSNVTVGRRTRRTYSPREARPFFLVKVNAGVCIVYHDHLKGGVGQR